MQTSWVIGLVLAAVLIALVAYGASLNRRARANSGVTSVAADDDPESILFNRMLDAGSVFHAQRAHAAAVARGDADTIAAAAIVLGERQESDGSSEAARASFTTATASARFRNAAWQRLGSLEVGLGNTEAARAAFQHVLDSSDREAAADAAWSIGVLEDDLGNETAAVAALTLAADLGNDEALADLGNRAWEAGRFDDARTYFERVLRVPETYLHGVALLNLGGLELELGNTAAARRALERCLATDDEHAGAGAKQLLAQLDAS